MPRPARFRPLRSAEKQEFAAHVQPSAGHTGKEELPCLFLHHKLKNFAFPDMAAYGFLPGQDEKRSLSRIFS
jgi:hypothetical protein